MKLRDIICDECVSIYELERSITSTSMFGTILYKGNLKLLEVPIHGRERPLLEREVFRLFSGYETKIIVL